ncbi:MAG: cysteine synthase A [Solobacterium sp.]|nr:cysteine synthase A [Solobacterium sp.]
MTKIITSLVDLIGNTPLFEAKNVEEAFHLHAKLLVKLEYLNPTGSVKDRIAKAMIEDAEEKGLLNKDSIIIEPTSGNTGIGLAAVAKAKGYRAILVMPESMSVERRQLLKAYGAEIVLSPASKGMAGAVEMAEELAKENPNSFIPRQFDNPANWQMHYKTTGPEIWNDTDGMVDFFVAGVGTGGTLTGTGKYLKEKNPQLQLVAVEPSASPLLSKGEAGPHKIQGIGANFIPTVLDTALYDEVMPINDEDAFTYGKMFGKTEGILVGISSGAALAAGIAIAQKEENEGKVVVVLLPDSGDRYLSTPLFQDE